MTQLNTRVIAIEGLCFAGKSTLAARLLEFYGLDRCVVLPDYSDMMPSSQSPRLPASNLEQEVALLQTYLELDDKRWQTLNGLTAPMVIIQDRCHHTLLAHAYANGLICGYNAMPIALELLRDHGARIDPHLVMYLKTSHATLSSRYGTITNQLPALLKSGSYMKYFESYFMEAFVGPLERLAFVQSDASLEEVFANALTILRANLR